MKLNGVQAPAVDRRMKSASPRTRLRAEAAAVPHWTFVVAPLPGNRLIWAARAVMPAWLHRSWAVTAVVWYGTEMYCSPIRTDAPAGSPQAALGILLKRPACVGLWEPTMMMFPTQVPVPAP